MNSILCSENFKKFFGNIESAVLPPKEISDVVGKNLPIIADEISLGKMVCELVSPPMPYNEKGENVTKEIFCSPDGFEDAPVRNEFTTGNNGRVFITSYPAKGKNWNADDVNEITFLHKSIFVIFGRSSLTDIVKTSLSTDTLTKLPNVTGFIGIGEHLFKQGLLSNYTAMFINLKKFRCINSQIGNKNGDKVICMYAATLRQRLAKDEFVARPGGDNFALLVKKENTKDILDFLSEVCIDVELDSTVIPLTISPRIGMYHIQQGDNMRNVMNCISVAANNARRNPAIDVVLFTPEIMKRMEREGALSSVFANAVANKEFIVYYQPKVDLHTSKMCGCEALVRWQRDGRMVSPMEFIPIFERDGNICALDFYMLDNVCRNIREWLDMGLEPVTVSVNFSKTHLHNPNIGEEIMTVINKYDIDTRFVEIELTEMSDFSDYEAFKNLVSKMKKNGVKTSIDDFGTGYSSLNLLTDFMFDVVKLDKSFLDNISRSHSKKDEIVVRNIVKMIRELGMKAIAEGVETVEQAQFLKDIECTMVQGYLYDKPLTVEEFTLRLKTKKYEKVV